MTGHPKHAASAPRPPGPPAAPGPRADGHGPGRGGRARCSIRPGAGQPRQCGRHGLPAGWRAPLLTVVFYALIIWCYLRRGPAPARPPGRSPPMPPPSPPPGSRSLFPLLPRAPVRPVGNGRPTAAAGRGTGLGGVVAALPRPQPVSARAGQGPWPTRGPTGGSGTPCTPGRLVSSLGLTLPSQPGRHCRLAWVLCRLQVYRALREEQLLLAVTAGATAPTGAGPRRFLPGIF